MLLKNEISDPNIESIESLKMNPKVHYDFYEELQEIFVILTHMKFDSPKNKER